MKRSIDSLDFLEIQCGDEFFEARFLDGDYRIQVCNTDPRQTIIRT
jgi:hypothetical protein